MSRYTPTGTVSTIAQINTELEKIAESINDLLSRQGSTPNQMESLLDMNGKEIINLPKPTSPTSPVRKMDLTADNSFSEGLNFLDDRKFNNTYNVKDYGAVGDGVTDDAGAINTAISELTSAGGGVLYFPVGYYKTSQDHEITSNMVIKGESLFSTKVRRLDPDGSNTVFVKSDPDAVVNNVVFKDICIEGTWEDIRREGTGSLISARNVNNVYFDSCRFLHARAFSININRCRNVIVSNCRFLYGCRDMCAVWNTPNTVVVNNIFKGNDDDTISLNSAGFEPLGSVVKTKLVVMGNTLEDAGGIKVQSANTTIISNNVLQRNKGNQQISVTVNNANDREETNPQTVIIQSNIITDIIDRFLSANLTPSVNARVGFRIETKSGTITDPYDGYYTTDGQLSDVPIRGAESIYIKDNVVKRTLPAVANYSDWGFGRMFTRFSTDTFAPDGFVDPQITDSLMNARMVEIEGPASDVTFRDNTFTHSCLEAVDFQAASGETAEDFYYKRFRFLNNIFSNCSARAIDLTPFSGTQQDILIQGNLFDLDPLFVGTSRQADGSWSSGNNCVAVFASGVGGLRMTENTFKNCASPYIQGSAANQIFKYGNIFVGEPIEGYSVGTFDANNKGVGLYPLEIAEPTSSLFYVASDPTLSNYGEVYTQPQKSASGNGAPTQSYYFKGEFIPSRAGVADGDHTTLGLRRKVSGTGNDVGTDWELLQAKLGSSGGPGGSTDLYAATGNVINTATQSSQIRGIAHVGGGLIQAIASDLTNLRVYRYSTTTYAYNNQSYPITQFPEGLVDILYDPNGDVRWISGSATLGSTSLRQYDSNFVATGVTRNVSAAALAVRGGSRIAISSNGGFTRYSDDFQTVATSANLGVSDIVGASTEIGGTEPHFVTGSGVVYKCDSDGLNVQQVLDSGITDAEGMTLANGNIYICNRSSIVEFAAV